MLKKFIVISALLFPVFTVLAEPEVVERSVSVNGAMPVVVPLSNQQNKAVRLMSISLSQQAKNMVAAKAGFLMQHPFQKSLLKSSGELSAAKYVGMNEEPVLDQGVWGTCATFATTGAINALYALTNDSRVSQLCNLQLGRSIENPDSYGGWKGSFGFLVLNQINEYGYLDFQYQKTQGCGGLNEYPLFTSERNGSAMPKSDFTAHSIRSFTEKDWMPILAIDPTQVAFEFTSPEQAETALTKVKLALSQGNRVVFGSILDTNADNYVGALGTYNNTKGDTWVMTPKIIDDINKEVELSGHEIIIDGYDDNACATYADSKNADADSENADHQKQQCGLLRIRNSWGDKAGDHGDYYMSYDFFKTMVLEAYVIGKNTRT